MINTKLQVERAYKGRVDIEMGSREIKKTGTNLSYTFSKATLLTSSRWIKSLHKTVEFQGNQNTLKFYVKSSLSSHIQEINFAILGE